MFRRSSAVGLIAASAIAFSSLIVATPAHAAEFTVSGTIYGNPSGGGAPEPLSDALIYFFTPDSDAGAGNVVTESDGTYSIALPDGQYRMRVSYRIWNHPDDPSGWAPQWYGGSPFGADAALLDVSGNTTVDMTLDRAASISGIVSRSGGFVANAEVVAYLKHPTTGELQFMDFAGASSSNGNFTIKSLPEGQYVLHYSDRSLYPQYLDRYWQNAATAADATLVTVTSDQQATGFSASLPPWSITDRRLAGADRFATSVAISQDTFPDGAPIVFLANGLNFPDALAAGPAAAHMGGPVLLTPPSTLAPSVAAEIERLDPETVVIVGGSPSVSNAVESAVAGLGVGDIDRLAGSDRFHTSRLVAQYAFDGGSEAVFIATGLNFPDALSAGSAAARLDAPILLVNGAATAVDTATKNAIDSLGVIEIYVVGGAPSMGNELVATLRNLGVGLVDFAGTDRYDTSAKVLQNLFGSSETVYVATGVGFPDALAGAAAAGFKKMPLVITPPNCMFTLAREQISRMRVTEMILLGGPTTVAEQVTTVSC